MLQPYAMPEREETQCAMESILYAMPMACPGRDKGIHGRMPVDTLALYVYGHPCPYGVRGDAGTLAWQRKAAV